MLLPDAEIIKCIALFNKYSNSAVPSHYTLPLSDEDKQEIVDNVWAAYAIYTEDDTNKNVLEANKRHSDPHLNFVKVIWKVFTDGMPRPTPPEDYQVPTIPPEPDPDPTPYEDYGILYNWYAVNKTRTESLDPDEWGRLYNWYAAAKVSSPSVNIYGALYNWYAATNVNGLVPSGTHIPALAEWNTLVAELGANPGYQAREIGTVHWNTATGPITNSSGFTALGSGIRFAGNFINLKDTAAFMCSDNYGGFNTTTIWLYNEYQFETPGGTWTKKNGTSVRCLLDDPGSWTIGDIITDYDGNEYGTVKIGDQVWMASNLKVTHYNDSTDIPNITDDALWIADTTGAMCYYNNDQYYGSVSSPGLSPPGWHLPTLAEMNTLRTTIGGDGYGGTLKETGYTHWKYPNTNATDDYGLSLIGSGIRNSVTGLYEQFMELGSHWTDDDEGNSIATHWYVNHDNSNFSPAAMHYEGQSMATGLAVRFIKDDDTNPGTVTDYDNNVYPTVKIGDLVIMTENFRCTHYNDGTDIPELSDNTAWINDTNGAWCLNAYTVNLFPPAGWHVPSTAEFDTLVSTCNPSAGRHLKEAGTVHWNSPNTGDNTSMFNGIGGGSRVSSDGTFSNLMSFAYYHSSDDYVFGDLYALALFYDSSSNFKWSSGSQKNEGASVRLIKDDSIDPGFVTDYDGNIYTTALIGSQVWMTGNYNCIHYIDGTDIPNIIDNGDWIIDTDGAYCVYDNQAYTPPIVQTDPQMPQYYLISDGVAIYRKGVRNGAFVIDISLTVLSFGGVEGTDWINLQTTI